MPEANVAVVIMATRMAGKSCVFEARYQSIDISAQHETFSALQGCAVRGTERLEAGEVNGID